MDHETITGSASQHQVTVPLRAVSAAVLALALALAPGCGGETEESDRPTVGAQGQAATLGMTWPSCSGHRTINLYVTFVCRGPSGRIDPCGYATRDALELDALRAVAKVNRIYKQKGQEASQTGQTA